MLSWLVAHAAARADVPTSIMVKLRCDSPAERFLIPGFIFFFQMLYPFAWVNRRDSATAAAAGGCMLVRTEALRLAGGIDAIRDALIDDCALARRLKAEGPIWLGLTERIVSIRSYPHWHDIAAMVARSAYAQLGYSPWQLAGAVTAMTLTYLVPPVAALFGSGAVFMFGIGAWAIMAILYQPVLRLYRLSPLWGLALPATAFAYLLFTMASALASMRGQGRIVEGALPGGEGEMTGSAGGAAVRQGPPGREFPGRLAADRRQAPRPHPGVLRIRPHRRRHRRSPDARRAKSWPISTSSKPRCSAAPKARPPRGRCAPRWRNGRCRRAMPRICSTPSGWTSPSCATPTGTS